MRFSKFPLLCVLLVTTASAQYPVRFLLTPNHVAVGSGDLRVTVSGLHLTNNLQIFWNGQPTATQFVDSRTLKATIPASNFARPGLAEVTLADSVSGSVLSVQSGFLTAIPMQANDLLYDSQRDVIYISVSKLDPNGPSIAIMHPETGAVDRYITVPSDPGVLAISGDSHYLYVALSGLIRRFDLATNTSALDIPLPSLATSLYEPYLTSILPIPNQSASIAVSGGLETAAFDGATIRQNAAIGNSLCLLFSPDGNSFYGAQNYQEDAGLYQLLLNANGFSNATAITHGVGGGQACPFYENGLIYFSDGNVLNPLTTTVEGTFGVSGMVVSAPDLGQTWFLGEDTASASVGLFSTPLPSRLSVMSNTSFGPLKSISLPAQMVSFSGRLVRWGTTGIGFIEYPNIGQNATASTWVDLFQVPQP